MRPHPRWDLVVLDLDGTIFDPAARPTLSPRTCAAIAQVQARGVPVTLATGRTLEFAAPLGRQLGLHLPAVTAQGAVVGCMETGRIFFEALMSQETSAEILRWAGRARRVVATYIRRPGEPLCVVQNREDQAGIDYDHLFGTPRRLAPWPPRAVDLERDRVLKFIVVNPPHEPDHGAALRRRFTSRADIARTHPDLLEGTPPGVDKGSGLARLLDMLRIDPKRVLAIGDQENDLPMLRSVGFGVAMAGAPARVRAQARWTAPPFAEDGAAQALERFVLSPEDP